MPTGPLAKFPDVYESMFGEGRKEQLLSAIEGFGTDLRASTGGMLGGVATAGSDLSTAGYAGLDAMVTDGPTLGLRRHGNTSVAIVGELFGGERELVRQHRQGSTLAQVFDEVMAGSGIALAAAAIPIYVGGMKDYWSARSERRPYPTSAHILARNGRLAMVRVPSVALNAPGRQPDGELAQTIGDRFRAVVTKSYLDGRDRMAQLAQPVAAAGGGPRG
jgi:hypothetical protein